MNNEKKTIIMDSNEPKHIQYELEKAGLIVERKRLKAGDYCIGNILLERKTIDDYWSTMYGKRLFKQLFKMKNSDKRCFLVIIGNYPSRDFDMPKREMEKRIKGMGLISFISFGVMFTRAETEEKFIEFIKWLWERCTTKTYAPVVKSKGETSEQMRSSMLGCINGIGSALAEELSHFTFQELIDMGEDLKDYKFHGRRIGKKASLLIEVLKNKNE